jgi:chemotaxis protein MotB
MTTVAPFKLMETSAAGGRRRLWLITFVDLVMLLLAFFVLLFSMSAVDQPEFTAVIKSYADSFGALGGPEELPSGPSRVPRIEAVHGDNLAYLETVLRSSFSTVPILADVQFRRTAQYLMLSLQVPEGPDRGGVDLGGRTAQMQRQIFELAGVLNNLSNRVAVVVPVAATAGHEAWTDAEIRAQAVRSDLQGAGYTRDIVALARGVPAEREDSAGPVGIDVVIFPDKARTPAP